MYRKKIKLKVRVLLRYQVKATKEKAIDSLQKRVRQFADRGRVSGREKGLLTFSPSLKKIKKKKLKRKYSLLLLIFLLK